MTEFVLRLGVSYEELSYAFAAKGIGVLIGALIGGLVKDKFITRFDNLEYFIFITGVISNFCQRFYSIMSVHALYLQ